MTTISSATLQQQQLLVQQQQSAAAQATAAASSAPAAAGGAASAADAVTAGAPSLTSDLMSMLIQQQSGLPQGSATASLAGLLDQQTIAGNGTTATQLTTGSPGSLAQMLNQQDAISANSVAAAVQGQATIGQSAQATSSVMGNLQAFLTQIGL